MSPVVLGIDTSGSWCSAALVRGADRFVRRAEVGSAHSTFLLAMIHAVLEDAAIGLDALDAVAFSAGPGSFTGLRVGCAVAQGLAYAASRPVASIGTLDALAHSLRDDVAGRQSLLVAQDARMGEVYWSLHERCGETFRGLRGPALAAPDLLHETLRTDRPIDVGGGNAWAVHGAAMDDLVGRSVRRESADAMEVAELGVIAVRDGRLIAPEAASPLYVRNDIARTTAQRDAAARQAVGNAPRVVRRPGAP